MLSHIQKIIKEDEYKRGQRGNWDSLRQDVANFVIPRKAWITTPHVIGARIQDDYLYDSRAQLALKESACGFHSKLTNPATRWFETRTLKEKFMQSGNVQKYFKEVDDILYELINNSNWDECMLEFYTDDLSVGVASILTEEDYKTHVRYTSVPIEQANWELDDRGELYKYYRSFKWSAYKCQTRFKDKITAEMRKALTEDKGFTMFDIMHYVGPRDARNVAKKDSVSMEFESIWIAKKEEEQLGESGFVEMPYELTRFWVHADDDDGGYSPAMDVLAAIKTVNSQYRTITRAGQKAVDPAYMMPSRFWIAPLNGNPGAMNYYDATKFKAEQMSRLPGGENLKVGIELVEIQQVLIDRGFFLPLFRAMSDVHKQMTVPEVQQRIAEGLGLIGPVVGRMTKTQRGALLRTYGIADRRGLLPVPPKEVQDQELSIGFLSPLAKAQRQSELQGLAAWVEFVKGLSELIPSVRDKLDGDRIVDVSRDLFSADPTTIKDDEKVKQVRKVQAQAQKQAMDLQMAQAGAGVAESAANAHKTAREASKV